MPIIADNFLSTGILPEDESCVFLTLAQLDDQHGDDLWVACENHVDVTRLQAYFSRIALIRLEMPHFSDGRAFSQAQRLRDLGFVRRLRIAGHVIPDQWPHIRQVGVDEVAISQQLLERTTLEAWSNSIKWPRYQQRLQQGIPT